MGKSDRLFIVGPALISGLGTYLPAGYRGAVFCLFPGLAQRSPSIAVKGAACGFVLDMIICIGWGFLGWDWEPRVGWNLALSHYLPPMHTVITGGTCTVSNGTQFGLGLLVWTTTMFTIWLWFWKPHMKWRLKTVVLTAGAAFVGITAGFLWTIAPMDEWPGNPASPFGDLAVGPFLAVFLASMPACCLLVACLTYYMSKRPSMAIVEPKGHDNDSPH
ncbi:MAG: hypothetical protein JW888_06150 [Pirellulales bacterium]|nr:hypothetical protein [Pirellulales bacterium]